MDPNDGRESSFERRVDTFAWRGILRNIDRLLTSIVKVQIVRMACIVMNVKSLYIYAVVDIAW